MCGRCSLAKYYLAVDSGAIVICIDRRDPEDALSEIPKHLLSRIRYVQMDVIKLNMATLRQIVKEQCNVTVRDVYHIHASLDCTTYSLAHSKHTSYRLPDGTINPDIPQRKHCW